jgi:hypothetical protein
MSYSISVRVIEHSDPQHWFRIVEKTNWHYANGGTWAECNGVHTLTMGGSGTSGMLRFMNNAGEYFLVALGVHNYKRWCDIVTDAKCSDTGVLVHPTYYENGSPGRGEMLWKQLPRLEKTSAKGTKVTVTFTQGEGNCLQVTITITTGCHPQPQTCPPQPQPCHPQPQPCHPPPQTCHPRPQTCHPRPHWG